MARSLIPPTYKDLARLDPETGRIEFDPEWLNWFLRIRQIIDGGGTVGPEGPSGPPGFSFGGDSGDDSGGSESFGLVPGPRGEVGSRGDIGATWLALMAEKDEPDRPWVPSISLPVITKVLSVATTVFVRTDGNDTNDGFSNTTAGAWLTIQHAVNVVKTWSLNGFQVIIQLADGTYTGAIVCNGLWFGSPVSDFPVIIQGNTGTPANVIVNVTGDAITVQSGAVISLKAFKIVSTGFGINSKDSALVNIDTGMNFGACTSGHMQTYSGRIYLFANYTISGAAPAHFYTTAGGRILGGFGTTTVTGTPAFSVAFAESDEGSVISMPGVTYSGSATGKRYSSIQNSVIDSGGGGANYFPGNVAGTTATGGIYA